MGFDSQRTEASEWLEAAIERPVAEVREAARKAAVLRSSIDPPVWGVIGSLAFIGLAVATGEFAATTYVLVAIGLIAAALSGLVLADRVRDNRAAEALEARRDETERASHEEWAAVLAYLRDMSPSGDGAVAPEDAAALDALRSAQLTTETPAWRSDQLDRFEARIDVMGELHAVLDAARDIAAVRARVGPRPDERYVDAWLLEIDALDDLARDVRRRADLLADYESTIQVAQASLEARAESDRRRDSAAAVDDLLRRRGGDAVLGEAAAGRIAAAQDAHGLVDAQLRAARDVKSRLDASGAS